MESDPTPSSTPRKVKFAPKGPPLRKARPPEPKSEVAEEGDDADDKINEALLRKVNDHLTRRRPKAEKKSSVQVAFAHGVASSTSIRTYGRPREGTGERIDCMGSRVSTSDDMQDFLSLPSTAGTNGAVESFKNATDSIFKQKKREYKEPWDYNHSYYPVTLPLRRPHSGDPELLDEEEIGEARSALEYDENTIHSASDLGLLEESDGAKMLFLQFPGNIPLGRKPSHVDNGDEGGCSKLPGAEDAPAIANKKVIAGRTGPTGIVASAIPKGREVPGCSSMVSTSTKGKGMLDSFMSSNRGNASKRVCSLEELPSGYMGKMLVYKSGAIKLKLGDVLYDVSSGSDCVFAQDVATVNTVEKHFCALGELSKRAVVTPDIDSLLE